MRRELLEWRRTVDAAAGFAQARLFLAQRAQLVLANERKGAPRRPTFEKVLGATVLPTGLLFLLVGLLLAVAKAEAKVFADDATLRIDKTPELARLPQPIGPALPPPDATWLGAVWRLPGT